jgi:capsule polysaccharide export protein KpsE/RkpR
VEVVAQGVDSPATDFRQNIDLLAAITLLWSERYCVLRWVGIGLLTSIVIALLIPAQFDSTAQLMPPDQSGSTSALMNAAAERAQNMMGLSSDVLGGKTQGALFAKVMLSQTVEDTLVNRFDLRKVYRVRYAEYARKQLESRTDISEDRKSGILTIRVRDRDPRRARDLCQAYVDTLNDLITKLHTSSARREREFLEQRLAVIHEEVDRASLALGQFSSKHTTVDLPAQTKATVESVATLEGKLVGQEAELNGLKQIYGDENARVRSLSATVAALRHNLQSMAGDGSDGVIRPEMPAPTVRSLPLLGTTYSELLRQAKLSEAVLEVLTKQYELARVQEAKEVPTVQLLDPPSYPEKRAAPTRSLIALLGALLGLVAGILGARYRTLDEEDRRKQLVTAMRRTVVSDLRGVRIRLMALNMRLRRRT